MNVPSMISQFKNSQLMGRSVVLDNELMPGKTTFRTSGGWRLFRDGRSGETAEAYILGPTLTRWRLDIDRELVNEWIKGVPNKGSLWSASERAELPKKMLVVL